MYKKILTAETAANGAPSGAPDNTESSGWWFKRGGHRGGNEGIDLPMKGDVICLVSSTAGSGTMTASIRLWGYLAKTDLWYPLGPGGGVMNEGNDLEEVAADTLRHAEVVSGLAHFNGIYAELVTIGGTSTAVDVELA